MAATGGTILVASSATLGATDYVQSRAWVPAHMRPDEDDTRRLGVDLSDLRIDGVALAPDDARLTSGWHAPEPEWRWTDDDAGLALAGAREISFRLEAVGSYWARGKAARSRAA